MKEQVTKIEKEKIIRKEEKSTSQKWTNIKGDIDDFIFYDNEKLVSER